MSIIRHLLSMWIISIKFSIGPMGCLFSRRCWANLDFLFPYLKTRKCSWKRTLKSFPVFPTYFMLQDGHVNWYMQHFSYLFLDCFCHVAKCFSIALSAVNVTLTLVFLSIFVISLVFLPTYVNLAHFALSTSCVCFFLWFTFFRIEVSYLLLVKICCIVLISFCILSCDDLYVFILLWK